MFRDIKSLFFIFTPLFFPATLTTSHTSGPITSRSFVEPFSVTVAPTTQRYPSGSFSGIAPVETTSIAIGPSASHSCLAVMNARLDHELQKSRVAKSQIAFLKSQIASETAARIDAQVCNRKPESMTSETFRYFLKKFHLAHNLINHFSGSLIYRLIIHFK